MSKYGCAVYDGVTYTRYKVNGYYILYKCISGVTDYSKWWYEHRIAYESANGIVLTSDQIVHHKNHIRTDNRIENLEVLSNEEHSRMHKKERDIACGHNVDVEEHYCIDCGIRISPGGTRCIKCSHKRLMTEEHPTKDQLSNWILVMNNSEIARMCGVSDAAVRKWRKKYDLPSANEQHGWSRGIKKADVA